MERVQLEKFLKGEGYDNPQILQNTTDKLLSLSGICANMLVDLVESGNLPTFASVNGVDDTYLRDRLQMKSPAIIIAYAMLLDDPIGGSEYFKNLAEKKVVFNA